MSSHPAVAKTSLEMKRRDSKEKRAHFLPLVGTKRAYFLLLFGTWGGRREVAAYLSSGDSVDSKQSVDTTRTGRRPVPPTKTARQAGGAAILATHA